jgi:hypothetical protein
VPASAIQSTRAKEEAAKPALICKLYRLRQRLGGSRPVVDRIPLRPYRMKRRRYQKLVTRIELLERSLTGSRVLQHAPQFILPHRPLLGSGPICKLLTQIGISDADPQQLFLKMLSVRLMNSIRMAKLSQLELICELAASCLARCSAAHCAHEASAKAHTTTADGFHMMLPDSFRPFAEHI